MYTYVLVNFQLYATCSSAVTTPAPELIVDCDSMYSDDGTINIFTTWRVPDEDWLLETIAYFNIVLSLVDIGHASSAVFEQYSNITVNNDVSYPSKMCTLCTDYMNRNYY